MDSDGTRAARTSIETKTSNGSINFVFRFLSDNNNQI
jgi:hypothetical protein